MTRQDEERERRLAEALRENLRRRKAQTRERQAGAADDALRPEPPEGTDAGAIRPAHHR